jgi:plastocyanin
VPRRAILILALCSLIASSCTLTGGAATYDVNVDTSSPAFNLQVTAYFPNDIKVHPGDTVRFTDVDRGEPHTVTFGTLVDGALAKIPPGPPVPTLEPFGLPDLIGGAPPQLVVSQTAAQPCFIATGPLPKGACAKDQQTQPEFNGTQAFFNSGYLPDKQVFALKLADTIKPGVYGFMCLLHTNGMTGKLTVVDKAQATQSQDDLKKAAAAMVKQRVDALQGAVDAAAKSSPDKAFAGVISDKAQDAQATVFAPKEISIPVGGSVTWQVFGPHVIAFNAPTDATGAITKLPAGGFDLNGKAFAPSGGPGAPPPPPGAAPPPPNAPPQTIPVVAPGWDGKGFHSSGFFLSFPPTFFSYKLTFTTAGTYPYKCLIHPDMEGSIKVGQ